MTKRAYYYCRPVTLRGEKIIDVQSAIAGCYSYQLTNGGAEFVKNVGNNAIAFIKETGNAKLLLLCNKKMEKFLFLTAILRSKELWYASSLSDTCFLPIRVCASMMLLKNFPMCYSMSNVMEIIILPNVICSLIWGHLTFYDVIYTKKYLWFWNIIRLAIEKRTTSKVLIRSHFENYK